MAIKSVVVDESGTHHLILGLNRENVDSVLNGNVFTFPKGLLSGLSEDSDIVLLFPETDQFRRVLRERTLIQAILHLRPEPQSYLSQLCSGTVA
jgi:hypothetical protein